MMVFMAKNKKRRKKASIFSGGETQEGKPQVAFDFSVKSKVCFLNHSLLEKRAQEQFINRFEWIFVQFSSNSNRKTVGVCLELASGMNLEKISAVKKIAIKNYLQNYNILRWESLHGKKVIKKEIVLWKFFFSRRLSNTVFQAVKGDIHKHETKVLWLFSQKDASMPLRAVAEEGALKRVNKLMNHLGLVSKLWQLEYSLQQKQLRKTWSHHIKVSSDKEMLPNKTAKKAGEMLLVLFPSHFKRRKSSSFISKCDSCYPSRSCHFCPSAIWMTTSSSSSLSSSSSFQPHCYQGGFWTNASDHRHNINNERSSEVTRIPVQRTIAKTPFLRLIRASLGPSWASRATLQVLTLCCLLTLGK